MRGLTGISGENVTIDLSTTSLQFRPRLPRQSPIIFRQSFLQRRKPRWNSLRLQISLHTIVTYLRRSCLAQLGPLTHVSHKILARRSGCWSRRWHTIQRFCLRIVSSHVPMPIFIFWGRIGVLRESRLPKERLAKLSSWRLIVVSRTWRRPGLPIGATAITIVLSRKWQSQGRDCLITRGFSDCQALLRGAEANLSSA